MAPTLTVYREIADIQGWYINLGISHSFELSHEITLDLAGSVRYLKSTDDDRLEVGSNSRDNAIHDGLITAGLTIPFGGYFSACPMIGYSFPLSNDADDLLKGDNVWSSDSEF